MWQSFNENPKGQKVGDCVVRAISTALDQSWDHTYIGLCLQGYEDADLPSSNAVWSRYLRKKGWKRRTVQDDCTVQEFCGIHPKGIFVLGTGSHAVAVIDGSYYDFWDSGSEIVLYFFENGKDDR